MCRTDRSRGRGGAAEKDGAPNAPKGPDKPAEQTEADKTPATPIGLELNKIETREGACRAHFVVRNRSERKFDAFRVDIVFFNKQQIVEQRLALNLAPVRPKKTTVLIFSIAGTDCAILSKALVNDVTECRDTAGDHRDCVTLIAPSSRTEVDLIK